MTKFYKFGLLVYLFLGLLCTSSVSFGQCAFTNLNSTYCVDDASFTLTGGTNYYGAGVSGTTFNPANAGAGIHQVVTTDGTTATYTVNTTGTFSPVTGSGNLVALSDDG